MMDVAGAAETLPLLSTNVNLTSMGVVPQNAAILSTQNMMTHGAFALIAPLIQKWWPTRDEVQTYVFQEIDKAFIKHHSIPQHSAGYGIASATIPGQTIITPGTAPIEIPKYTALTKMGRPIPMPISASALTDDIDIGSFEIDGVGYQMEVIMAWAADISLPYLST